MKTKEKGSWRERKTSSGAVIFEYRVEGRSFYGPTQDVCRDKYKEYKSSPPKPKSLSFGQWAVTWLELYKHHKVSDGTYLNSKNHIEKHLVPVLGEKPLEAIRPMDVQKVLVDHADKSESFRHQLWLTLNEIMRTAVENGYRTDNPCGRYYTSREAQHLNKIKCFSEADRNRLVTEAMKNPNGYYILLPLYTGMRLGEIAGLQWADIHGNIIAVQRSISKTEAGTFAPKSPKSGKTRRIGISPKLAEILASIPHIGSYVLSDGAEYLTPHQIEYRYEHTFKEINRTLKDPIPYLSPHKCRHTFATALAEGGAAAKDVQQILGHASLVTTQQYFHTDDESILNTVSKLGY